MFNIKDLIVVKRDSDEPEFEIPKCLIAVDWKGKASIINILNEYMCDDFVIDEIKNTISEYEFEEGSGVYIANISIGRDNDFNGEINYASYYLNFGKLKNIKIEVEE